MSTAWLHSMTMLTSLGFPELDCIADTVGGETIAKLVPTIKPSGTLGSVVGAPETQPKIEG